MLSFCELVDGRLCWWSVIYALHTSLKGGVHCCCTSLHIQIQSLLPRSGDLCSLWHWSPRGGWVCLSGVLQKSQNSNHHRTCLGWSFWVHRHLQLLYASFQIREVSASSGGHLCLWEVQRACWRGVTWWQILFLLHAALLCCVHSRRKCSQHQLLLKALLLQGESHSELQSRLCIGQVLYQLELLFAQVCQNQNCPLGCAHSKRRWLEVPPSHYVKKRSYPSKIQGCNNYSPIQKKRESSSLCNHRGISLLSIAGKILARVLLNRLNEHLERSVLLPESQCGFRKNRWTIGMIIPARQLQDKCQEQNVDLYMTFVDLTKAFDTVGHEGLWKIMAKFGCPAKFIAVVRQ